MQDIANNLAVVRQNIENAILASGRKPGSVKLIAVSKFKPETALMAAISAGQSVFGENRVQEAKAKFADLRLSKSELELHLIGPLQSNKADDAVRLFDVIETLDRLSLAEALAKAIRKTGRMPKLYVEVNIGHEAQKSGVAPEALANFLHEIREKFVLSVTGLMCIPPADDNPARHFEKMKKLADQHKLTHLSMGMSADYEAAIRCGATEVRVGTAIFGERS